MIPHREKLSKAPLQEVVFEIHWKLDFLAEQGLYNDPGFAFASGRFSELAVREYSKYISLKPPTIPEQLFAFKAVHQFWKEDNTYPVMQLGLGLFTVNDTDLNYLNFIPQFQKNSCF